MGRQVLLKATPDHEYVRPAEVSEISTINHNYLQKLLERIRNWRCPMPRAGSAGGGPVQLAEADGKDRWAP